MGIYLYNEIELPALPEWDKETYPYAIISEGIGASLFVSKEPFTYGKFGAYGNMVILPAGRMLSTYDFSSWSDFSTQTAQQGTLSASWSNHDIINTEDGSVYLPASYPIDAETGEEIHDYEIGGDPVLSWNGKDAYAVINGSWVRCDVVKPTDGKWVKQDSYS